MSISEYTGTINIDYRKFNYDGTYNPFYLMFEDIELTEDEIKQIEQNRKDIAEGNYKKYTIEEYLKHLDSLDDEPQETET